MSYPMIDRRFYEAIESFDSSEAAQDYYYDVMNMSDGRNGTVRDSILRVYAMLFCEDMDKPLGAKVTELDVERTADRLYTGGMGFDPQHWYRMRHHFPIIDEDNYDRFAALVIADLKAGPLHDAALNHGDMLLVGEGDPLSMTPEQRRSQTLRAVDLGEGLL